jgi:hypothetical protein
VIMTEGSSSFWVACQGVYRMCSSCFFDPLGVDPSLSENDFFSSSPLTTWVSDTLKEGDDPDISQQS